MGIFFLAYVLFIKKQRDFRFNRFYLIFSALLATLIPLLNPGMLANSFQSPLNQSSVVQLREVIIGNGTKPSAFGADISIGMILFDIYFAGLLFMIIRFLLNLFQLYRLVRKSETKAEKGMKLIFPKIKLPVFSFFSWVFINKEIFENQEAASILHHEIIHVDQKHSFDTIMIQLLCIFQWFNPFVYLIKKSVKENHEFIADGDISSSSDRLSPYQILLFQKASGIEFSTLTNNFSYSLLKKRLIMMKNEKKPNHSSLKFIGAAIALSLTLFACSNSPKPTIKNVVEIQKTPITNEAKTNTVQADTGQVFMVVEKMPEFPGGINALMHYLSSHIKYPEQAKKAKIQGRVFVNFIIEKDGRVTHPKILKGIGHGCDKEALKVVGGMPSWNPGYQRGKAVRVSFNLPIKFTLE